MDWRVIKKIEEGGHGGGGGVDDDDALYPDGAVSSSRAGGAPFLFFSLFSFRDGHLPMPIRYPICYMGFWSLSCRKSTDILVLHIFSERENVMDRSRLQCTWMVTSSGQLMQHH